MLFVSLGIKSIVWIFPIMSLLCYLRYQNRLCGIIKYFRLCVPPHKLLKMSEKGALDF